MDSVIINSGNARLHTEFISNPDVETILFLHGGPGVPMDFAPIMDKLSAFYQVISFRQRGTGLSPAAANAEFSVNEYLADIEAIMQHFGLEKIHIFGHSWGGLYAQLFAERAPHLVSSLFLVSPSPDCGPKWLVCEHEVMNYHKSKSNRWQWLGMGINSLIGMLGSDKAYQKLFRRVIENYHRGFLQHYHCDYADVSQVRAKAINATRKQLLVTQPLTGNFNREFPIALMYGDKDIYQETKSLSIARLASAERVTISQAGHIAWLHNPSEFFTALTRFFKC